VGLKHVIVVSNMWNNMPHGDICMGILHIMREYGIKEGHRPVRGFEICYVCYQHVN
jgi:hypothetical protein